jgi:hypothetical protein
VVAAIATPAVLAADPVPGDVKNAAETCKALREAKGAEAFRKQWGTNGNGRNAFGKCVSQTAKARAAKRGKGKRERAGAAANADCKRQQAADPAKFAKDYRNFGQCVKAGKGAEGDDD